MQNRNFLKKQLKELPKELPKEIKVKKRLDLSRQFNEFKQRIQQFQEKNEQIIGRIRDAYSYKKKVIHNIEPYTIVENQIPNNYYDYANDAHSNDSDDNYSKRMAYENQKLRHTMKPNTRPYYQNEPNNDFQENVSVRQYRQAPTNQRGSPGNMNPSVKSTKGVGSRGRQKELIKYGEYMKNAQMSSKLRLQGQGYEATAQQMEFETNLSGHSPKLGGKSRLHSGLEYYSFQQRFREEALKNKQLQRQLQAKTQQMQGIRNSQVRFKSYSNNCKRLIEDELDNYQQVFMGQRFSEMEKHIKKCENRLKNLTFRLKDALEERRANQLILRSRESRRQSSRSHNKPNLVMSIDIKESVSAGRANSIHRPKKSEHGSNTQAEFQEIAASYEVMIKKKTEENEKLEKDLAEQVRLREITTGEVQKLKVFLEERQHQIAVLKVEKHASRQEAKEAMVDVREVRELKQKVGKLEEQVKVKQAKQRQLGEMVQKLQRSKRSMHEEYVQNLNKNKSIKGNNISELQTKIKQIEQQFERQMGEIREKLIIADRKTMEKQCELVNLSNKLKKVDAESALRQTKLKELQSLLLIENEHANLERSMSIDGTMFTQNDVQALQETVRKLDEEIEEKNNQIYELQKDKYLQQSTIKNYEIQLQKVTRLKAKVEEKVIALQLKLESRKQGEGGEEKTRLLAEKNELIEEFQAERTQLLEDKQEMISRNNQLLEQLKKLKQQNLAKNREAIKISSDLNFRLGEYSSLEEKYGKLQEKCNEVRSKLAECQEKKSADDRRHKLEIESYASEMESLRNHLLELASSKQEDVLLSSAHAISEVSFSHPSMRKFQEEEANLLREQLKQAEASLEVKVSMEQQIQSEYKSNIEQMRVQMAEKGKEVETYRQRIQQLSEELKISNQEKREDESFEFYKISLYEQKIVQLEDECNYMKESEERLNDMLHQIVDNSKLKEEEIDKMTKELQERDRLIEELKQLLSAKEAHSETTKHEREGTGKYVGILGDVNEQMMDPADMSCFSNMSEVFKQDGMLEQKIRKGKSSRDEQAKLFAKTSAYIRSLKDIIDNKQKRIRTLQKQIMSMKSQDAKTISCRQMTQENHFYAEPIEPLLRDIDEMVEYKDYDSVQLDTRKYKYLENTKQLQYEKNLAVEENKMLFNQIELLQDEIAKAEEQQYNLMRIKDLYKDEIKKLIEKNEKHTQEFESQIQKMRDEIEESDSVHNWEAIKQLFIKIISTIATLDDPGCKGAKKEQKRKELEQYIKVISSVMRIDNVVRDRLIASLKR